MNKANVNHHTEIAYKTTGKGTAIVLTHGHPFDYTMWQNFQIEAFFC